MQALSRIYLDNIDNIQSSWVTQGLEIGQMLPDNQEYNFRGVIDDITIYDYALHPDSIAGTISAVNPLANITGIHCFPNPTYSSLTVESTAPIQRIIVTDRSGAIVFNSKRHLNETRSEFSVELLPQGMYYLVVKTEEGFKTTSFVRLE